MSENLFPRLLTLRNLGGDYVDVVADATDDGLFAIHRSIGETQKTFWTVTHIPTLTAIASWCFNREEALTTLRTLRQMPWSWQTDDLKFLRLQLDAAPPGVRQKMTSLIAGVA